MADGRSFKLVFTPGAGFFYDYETFYIGTRARVLQFTQAADAADINAPLALTTYFYTRLFKNDPAEETIYSDKDIQYAQSLIKQFGEAGVRDLIDFAIEQAKQTHFEMQTIHAVRTFVPRWQTEQVKRARRLEDQKVEAQARHEEQLLREYNDYCDSLLQDYLGSCSPEELEEIQRQAEEATQDSQPLFRSVNQRLAKLRIARERCTIPTYEAWLENRK